MAQDPPHLATKKDSPFLPTARAEGLLARLNEAGIWYTVLKRHYTSEYNRILEYIETAFRPMVEDRWREIISSGDRPTLAEFAKRCGFRHPSILQRYFPDVAERLCTLDRK
jgi:hypothetical protein